MDDIENNDERASARAQPAYNKTILFFFTPINYNVIKNVKRKQK